MMLTTWDPLENKQPAPGLESTEPVHVANAIGQASVGTLL